MSCFLRAATPSRFNCCTGVNLLFLGSGMRTCWAWAATPPEISNKARTDGAKTEETVANGERMSFFKSSLQVPGPVTSHQGLQGSSSACQLDGKTLSQV